MRAFLGVIGDIDRPHVGRDRASDVDRIDDRAVDTRHRYDRPFLPRRTGQDALVGDGEPFARGAILAVDKQHHQHQDRDDDRHEQRRRCLGDGHNDGYHTRQRRTEAVEREVIAQAEIEREVR